MPSSAATSGGSRMLARSMRRANVRATIFLALFAGIAGASVLTALEISRRTASSYDRYLEHVEVADLAVLGCPAGLSEKDIEAAGGLVEAGCTSAENALVIRDEVLRVEGVVEAGSGGLGIVGTPDALAKSGWRTLLAWLQLSPGRGVLAANPLIVGGRLADPADAHELVMNEALAESGPYEIGDTITIRPFRAEQRYDVGLNDAVPEGPESELAIVGIVRMPDDLQAPRPTAGIPLAQGREGIMYLTEAWWLANGPDVATYFIGTALRLDPTVLSAEQFAESLPEILPDRLAFTEPVVTDAEPVRRVIGLQATAVLAIAGVLAIAALVFVAQALARQLGREIADRTTLAALGFTRRDLVAVAALRSLPIALGAACVAVLGALLLSPLGPVGVGREAEPDPGYRIDPFVLATGFLAITLLLTSLGGGAALLRTTDRRPRHRAALGDRVRWSPTARTGLLLGRTRGTRAAVGCATIAVAGIAGASGFSSSLHALEQDPGRYGVTWSLVLGEYSDRATWQEGLAVAQQSTAVASAAGFRASGESVGGVDMLVLDFSDAAGEIGPVILDGRAPAAADEVALGQAAMDTLGVDVGDVLESFGTYQGPVEVVGSAVGHDNSMDSANPSMIALVTSELFDNGVTFGSETSPQYVLVSLAPDVGLVEAAVALQGDFGRFVAPWVPPTDVRNLRLVAPAITIAAGVIVALAVAALAHSLISTTRVRRRDLATLRALGFTRGQVSAAVGWNATAVAALAAVIGVPLGLLAAHVSWRSIEDDLGVVSPPETPMLLIVVAVAGALVVANLVTLLPGRRAARMHPVEALRTE